MREIIVRKLTLLAGGLLVIASNQAMAQNSMVKVASTAFSAGSLIPEKFTCNGEDVSPHLSWSALPAETKSVALVVTDPDAPFRTFVHWVVYNLPPNTAGLPEGMPPKPELDDGARQGSNDFGHIGYEGPCPPPGRIHHYHFEVFALSSKIDLRAGADGRQLLQAMAGRIVASGDLIGIAASKVH
jgi:Raf kinase inhibitor-like YbhB/YbcL family protein